MPAMQSTQFRLLISELGTLQFVSLSESLSRLLARPEFGLKTVAYNDLRVRNLTFATEIFEINRVAFGLLASLIEPYQKMDKALDYYARKYSPALVKGVVGDFDDFFGGRALSADLYRQSLTDPNIVQTARIEDIDMQALPKQVIGELKHYFNEPFIVENVRLSDEKHVNAKLLDDTAEFRILFTILDVALPDETGIYTRQPLQVDLGGTYDNQIYFSFDHVKTDKAKFLGYDDRMYDKRQDYLQMIFDNAQDRDGKPLRQALEAVAQAFIYDFWLE